MNPHRKANAFPQAGIPGDPRLLDQMHRQQIRGSDFRITHTQSGTLISIKSRSTRRAEERHMWKVTADGESGGFYNYKVKGGIAVIQGTRVLVDEDAALVGGAVGVDGDTGFISLKVTRVAESRAYDPTYPPVIEYLTGTTAPVSVDTNEYTILAEVVDGVISQCRDDEICSFEGMFFENGEFKLLPIQANSRNSYNLPA